MTAKPTEAGVALLAEGVDRNSFSFSNRPVFSSVALLAEGVDRNCLLVDGLVKYQCRPPRGGRG